MMERFVTGIIQSGAFLIDDALDSHPIEQIRRSPDDLMNGFDGITYAKCTHSRQLSILKLTNFIHYFTYS